MTSSDNRSCKLLALAVAALAAILAGGIGACTARASTPLTSVVLSGNPAQVYFNDGDTFRVVRGSPQGAKARIAGFNALESYGPVHQWGSWTAQELYSLAKRATQRARRGEWRCESEGTLDVYGRLLVRCPDLAVELIRLGLAHTFSVDHTPGDPAYLAAQHEAIAARRGMWAQGVPPFVLTSLRSAEEDVAGGGTYNRLISTHDGHSEKWQHTTRYQECEKVCQRIYLVDEARVVEVMSLLRAEAAALIRGPDGNVVQAVARAEAAAVIRGLDDSMVQAVVRDYAAYRFILATRMDLDKRKAIEGVLRGYAEQGRFGNTPAQPGSCMVYVPYQRRFGRERAACLR